MREDVTFGGGCAAWHYVADVEGQRPCVVMAHGFGATRTSGLEPFAEGFAAAGFDVVLFDYRGFGASQGGRRQRVDLAGQRDDYRAAITFARELGGVDADRIVVWGVSLAGGHVLEVAARDPRIAAVIALTPAVDGVTIMRAAIDLNGMRAANALTAAAVRGQSVPITGPPGSLAVMTAPGAQEAYLGIAGPDWVNEVDARVMLRLGLDRPVRFAKQLTMPVLVQIADEDQTAPPQSAMKAAWDAQALVRHYPCDHFGVYPGQPYFDSALKHAVDFLRRTLKPG
jgi:pimeloyl-ACP methyl ester carboxylesterase